jgi:lysophospholipase L1-like esterase
MENKMRKVLIIVLIFSTFVLAEFIRDSNGIVRSTGIQLKWQDEYTNNDGVIKKANWWDAIEYCEQLNLGGNDDWRLPNKNELFSIADFNHYKPGIDPIFLSTNMENYWTSTSRASLATIHAWTINFINGSVHITNKNTELSIRCVRSGLSLAAAKPIFIIGDSTVYNYNSNQEGWGTAIKKIAINSNKIYNRAKGGESTKSYLRGTGDKSRSWENTKRRMLQEDTSNGAYLLIQFGHNDAALNGADNLNGFQTLPGVGTYVNTEDGFYSNLKIFTDWAKAHNFTPVLITPPYRKYYKSNNVSKHIIQGIGNFEAKNSYPETMRKLAQSENILLLDMSKRSKEEFDKYPTISELEEHFFINDNNHWHSKGALNIAKLVVSEACKVDDRLCAQFKDIY